jgi:glutamine synthetase
MQEFEPVLNEIRGACDAQNVLADIMIAEAGMCQFEINFKYVGDPLRAADQAILFKRSSKAALKCMASKRSSWPNRLARIWAGGMLVHVSVLDENGNNVFDDSSSRSGPEKTLLHATGGMLSSMGQLMPGIVPIESAFTLHCFSQTMNQDSSCGLSL